MITKIYKSMVINNISYNQITKEFLNLIGSDKSLHKENKLTRCVIISKAPTL